MQQKGQYLCDEMFYTCETQRRKLANDKIQLSAFIHVPVFGTQIQLVDSEETIEWYLNLFYVVNMFFF